MVPLKKERIKVWYSKALDYCLQLLMKVDLLPVSGWRRRFCLERFRVYRGPNPERPTFKRSIYRNHDKEP